MAIFFVDWCWFINEKWGFSIFFLDVYQRVLAVMNTHRIGKPMTQLGWDGKPCLCAVLESARRIRVEILIWILRQVREIWMEDGFFEAAWLHGSLVLGFNVWYFWLAEFLHCLWRLVFLSSLTTVSQDCHISDGGYLWFSANISRLSSVQNQCWLMIG